MLGIRDTLDRATDWAPRLAQLLDAHHYTDGLSFVPPGTPSNNTQDAPSGFSSADPGHATSYEAEHRAPAIRSGDGSRADALATALGLPSGGPVFSRIGRAADKNLVDARQMNTALWPATWGYFLSQILGVGGVNENPLTEDDIAWLRGHFIDFVRAGGPLPAVRIGKQPYASCPRYTRAGLACSSTRRGLDGHEGGAIIEPPWRRCQPACPRNACRGPVVRALRDLGPHAGNPAGSMRNADRW